MRVVLALAVACLCLLESAAESSVLARYRARRHKHKFHMKLKNIWFPSNVSGLPDHHLAIAKKIGDEGVRQHPNPPVAFRHGESYGMIGPIADYLRCAGHGNCFVTAVHDRHPWEGGYAGGTVVSEMIHEMKHTVAEEEIVVSEPPRPSDWMTDPNCVCEDDDCKNCEAL
jgi:hypothetical protein